MGLKSAADVPIQSVEPPSGDPVPQRTRLDTAVPESRIEPPFDSMPIALPERGEGASINTPTPRAFADCASTGLTEAQIAEYRGRLHRGFYASPAVVREVARRILESRDL